MQSGKIKLRAEWEKAQNKVDIKRNKCSSLRERKERWEQVITQLFMLRAFIQRTPLSRVPASPHNFWYHKLPCYLLAHSYFGFNFLYYETCRHRLFAEILST